MTQWQTKYYYRFDLVPWNWAKLDKTEKDLFKSKRKVCYGKNKMHLENAKWTRTNLFQERLLQGFSWSLWNNRLPSTTKYDITLPCIQFLFFLFSGKKELFKLSPKDPQEFQERTKTKSSSATVGNCITEYLMTII